MEPRPFLKTRYRVKLAKESDADHWSGGKPYHRGARCPACKIPLLLLWDINCRDPRFPRRKFEPLERLPFYFCWGCVSDVAYQIVAPDRIRLHPGRRFKGPTFPYHPYPKHFERRGLVFLEGVPEEIRHLYHEVIARWDSADDDGAVPEPTPEEQETLTEFFGHPVLMPICFFHHQLGGKPLLNQWAWEVFECPNPACVGAATGRARGKKRAMKFLAGVLNDPRAGLPMVEPANRRTRKHWDYCATVQYHICDCCWTVLGCNRCD
jgi:hypothetical protein